MCKVFVYKVIFLIVCVKIVFYYLICKLCYGMWKLLKVEFCGVVFLINLLVCRGVKVGVVDKEGKILLECVVEKLGVIMDEELFIMFFEISRWYYICVWVVLCINFNINLFFSICKVSLFG